MQSLKKNCLWWKYKQSKLKKIEVDNMEEMKEKQSS